VQLFTFVFYAFAVAGLWLHRKREPPAGATAPFEKRESRLVTILFVVLLTLALACSMLAGKSVLYSAIALNFVIWTLLGFMLTLLALAKGVRERSGRTERLCEIQSDKENVEQAPAGDDPKAAPEE